MIVGRWLYRGPGGVEEAPTEWKSSQVQGLRDETDENATFDLVSKEWVCEVSVLTLPSSRNR